MDLRQPSHTGIQISISKVDQGKPVKPVIEDGLQDDWRSDHMHSPLTTSGLVHSKGSGCAPCEWVTGPSTRWGSAWTSTSCRPITADAATSPKVKQKDSRKETLRPARTPHISKWTLKLMRTQTVCKHYLVTHINCLIVKRDPQVVCLKENPRALLP